MSITRECRRKSSPSLLDKGETNTYGHDRHSKEESNKEKEEEKKEKKKKKQQKKEKRRTKWRGTFMRTRGVTSFLSPLILPSFHATRLEFTHLRFFLFFAFASA